MMHRIWPGNLFQKAWTRTPHAHAESLMQKRSSSIPCLSPSEYEWRFFDKSPGPCLLQLLRRDMVLAVCRMASTWRLRFCRPREPSSEELPPGATRRDNHSWALVPTAFMGDTGTEGAPLAVEALPGVLAGGATCFDVADSLSLRPCCGTSSAVARGLVMSWALTAWRICHQRNCRLQLSPPALVTTVKDLQEGM